MFFRPDGKAVCADVIPFFENGKYYLFYLKDYRDVRGHGEGCDWNLLTTEDFVHFEDHGTVIPRGGEEDRDLYVYTGSCFRWQGRYVIFYTGHNPHRRARGLPEEVILRAFSDDLLHWEKDPGFCLEAPDWLEPHDFRDPLVYFDPREGRCAMLIAARARSDGPVNTRGVTMVAYSDDLDRWELSSEPFFAPEAYYAHECPDLFQMGGWYYLVFSEFTDRFVTTYRMSRDLHGPWITPRVNTFDGHAFYAAKSAGDGERRFLFGWNPIKDGEQDLSLWQWGGNIVVHELVQRQDGTLWVKCPEPVREHYDVPLPWEGGMSTGSVREIPGGFYVGNPFGRSVKMLGQLPKRCRIETDLVPRGETGDFGFLLRADWGENRYYTVRFEPSFCRLAFDRWPRKDQFIHTSVDVERNCRLKSREENHIVLLIEDSVLEVYVNGETAMGARMFDSSGQFGIYTMSAQVEFKNLAVYGEREGKNEQE